VSKPHSTGDVFERLKRGRRHVTAHRQIACARLQILPHGHHVDVMPTKIMQHIDNLVVRFTEPEHQARFRQACGATRLEHAQQLE
jgi:hypothetical protein